MNEKKTMLTVKLVRGNTTKIVEAVDVEIQSAGKPDQLPDGQQETQLRPFTNRVRAIVVQLPSGRQAIYHVALGDAECGNGVVELWDCAYIENAHGATTERVYAHQ